MTTEEHIRTLRATASRLYNAANHANTRAAGDEDRRQAALLEDEADFLAAQLQEQADRKGRYP
jgi:hypothetical protein